MSVFVFVANVVCWNGPSDLGFLSLSSSICNGVKSRWLRLAFNIHTKKSFKFLLQKGNQSLFGIEKLIKLPATTSQGLQKYGVIAITFQTCAREMVRGKKELQIALHIQTKFQS
jgi:hypothetical protein